MLNIISLHNGMVAVVRIGTSTTDKISIHNGLRQGCTLAPTLFNIYYSTMINHWRNQCGSAGMDVRFNIGRKLVGDRTAKSRLTLVRVKESQFADDTAIYTSPDALTTSARDFIDTANFWGLTVNTDKTKAMVSPPPAGDTNNPSFFSIGSDEIEIVDHFPFLGSLISCSNRISRVSAAFGSLNQAIFQKRSLSLGTCTKRGVYCSVVLPTLLYGTETWMTKTPDVRRLTAFHNRCIRIILGVNRFNQWTEHISSTELVITFGMVETIEDMLIAHRLRWLGHLARMGPERLPKQLLFGKFEKTRPQHGTRKRCRDCIVADLKATKITEWYQLAQDRETWKNKCTEGIAMRKRPAE